MKLLIENTEDLKKHLSFIDADFTFDNLKRDLEDSTRVVIKLIGRDLYNHIVDINETESALVNAVAYPICVNAYRDYVKNNDVSHTNNGRLMRVSDDEKRAFEWMIARDDKQLEVRYYRALDNMIEILDEENPEFKSKSVNIKWRDSSEYKKTFNSLFRTADDFNVYFPIESRFLLMKLVPGINRCIDNEVIPRLGLKNWKEIQKKISSSSPDEKFNILIQNIKEACAYYTLSWSIKRLSVNLFPEGVLQNYVSDRNTVSSKKTPEKTEVGVVALSFNQDFETAIFRMEHEIERVFPTNPQKVYDIREENINPNDSIIDL